MQHAQTSEHAFEVVSNERVAEGIHRLVIRSSVAALIEPGQFMNLRVPGDGAHVLRIPLSFKGTDRDEGTVELLYAVVGEGTTRLSHMRAGDGSTLVGPCGAGWRLPAKPGRALLVAGGIGLPPVLAAARMLAEAGIGFDVVVGARTYAMHVVTDVDEVLRYGQDASEDAYDPTRAVILTTDDGTTATGEAGHKAYATDGMAKLLAERTYAQVYSCGPTIMMAAVARIAREQGIACQVSLERMMGCGFGACSCCNVALASGGYALCCQDGPVFDAEEVAW